MEYDYFSLFAVAFLAATILPAYSEIVFAGMIASGYDPFTVWIVASMGNTLGSAVNWVMGRYLLHYQDRKWFPFKPESLSRYQAWFKRYGVWSLLMAWAPVGGDALTFIAGLMRVNFVLFFVLTFIGKSARYGVLLGVVDQIVQFF